VLALVLVPLLQLLELASALDADDVAGARRLRAAAGASGRRGRILVGSIVARSRMMEDGKLRVSPRRDPSIPSIPSFDLPVEVDLPPSPQPR
jgi:hypothetical protein